MFFFNKQDINENDEFIKNSPIYNNLSKYPSFSKLILGEMTLIDLIF